MFPFESSPSNKNKWETCNNCFYHSFYNKQLVHFEKIYLFLLLIKARKNSKKKRAQDRQDTNLSRLSCLTCCTAKKIGMGLLLLRKSSSPFFSDKLLNRIFVRKSRIFWAIPTHWPNQRTALPFGTDFDWLKSIFKT